MNDIQRDESAGYEVNAGNGAHTGANKPSEETTSGREHSNATAGREYSDATDEQTDADREPTEALFGEQAWSSTASGPAVSHAETSAPATSSADRDGKRPAVFGTILWGVILLIFAAVMVITALPIIVVDTATLVIGAVVGAGVLLVVAGIVAAFRRG